MLHAQEGTHAESDTWSLSGMMRVNCQASVLSPDAMLGKWVDHEPKQGNTSLPNR